MIGFIISLVCFYLLGSILVFGRLTAISYEACENALYGPDTIQPQYWWKIPGAYGAGVRMMCWSWFYLRKLIHDWDNMNQRYLFKWSYKPLFRKYEEMSKSSEDKAQEILDQIDW